MSLPNPGMSFTPFDPLPASDLNDMVENIEALSDGTGLEDGAVTPGKLLAGTGTSWAWQSWTPTFTNLSGGTLTYAKYKQVGKTVDFRVVYTLGGAGVSGNVSLTLPVTGVSTITSTPLGIARLVDINGSSWLGHAIAANTTSVAVLITDVNSATYPIFVALSSTIPFTWAVNDVIHLMGTYEAA